MAACHVSSMFRLVFSLFILYSDTDEIVTSYNLVQGCHWMQFNPDHVKMTHPSVHAPSAQAVLALQVSPPTLCSHYSFLSSVDCHVLHNPIHIISFLSPYCLKKIPYQPKLSKTLQHVKGNSNSTEKSQFLATKLHNQYVS
jgi:hypothetical protein